MLMTDFASPRSTQSPLSPYFGIGSAVFTTFALGFTEGCLTIERRPIPLRFALRYAVTNLLPSVVWSSIPARHVAAASGVSLSSLISDVEAGSSRSVAVGGRLVLVKSVKALRLAVGSYGLAWNLWRYTVDCNNNKKEVVQYGEKVVRLAPVNSPLSGTSRRKHGDHILTIPMLTESWKHDVEWDKVGIKMQSEDERVKVVEVELGTVETTAEVQKLNAHRSRNDDTKLCFVGVLPPYGPPLLTSVVDAFDVHFNPVSAVLTFIAAVCYDRDVKHVYLVKEENGGSSLSIEQLEVGLLSRYGITASVLSSEFMEVNDESMAEDRTASAVFFLSDSWYAAAQQRIEQGLFVPEDACFIVNESLHGQNVLSEDLQAKSALLSMVQEEAGDVGEDEQKSTAIYMSIADVTDQTLQGIRAMLRQGKSSDSIQSALYEAYGTQRVVAPTRLDQFSDLQV